MEKYIILLCIYLELIKDYITILGHFILIVAFWGIPTYFAV
jgi:hypothetical protein